MEGKDMDKGHGKLKGMTDLEKRQAEALGRIIEGMERGEMPYADPVRWAILGSLLDDTGDVNDLKNERKKK